MTITHKYINKFADKYISKYEYILAYYNIDEIDLIANDIKYLNKSAVELKKIFPALDTNDRLQILNLLQEEAVEEKNRVVGHLKKLDSEIIDEPSINHNPDNIERLILALESVVKVNFLKRRLSLLGYSYQITTGGDLEIKYVPTPIHQLTAYNDPHFVHIFPSVFAYKLFERLHDYFKDGKNHLADYGFVYWKMYNDGLILRNIKPAAFQDWLVREYKEIKISNKFKTLDRCSTLPKESLYKTVKDLYSMNTEI